jgi:Methyltransferase domain
MQPSNFREGILIDIAAELSPFGKVVTKIYPEAEVYQQYLTYGGGIHGFQIGGNATPLPVNDSSINLMPLHNFIENFEGTADSLFFLECARVLKKGGDVIILPVFLKKESIQLCQSYNKSRILANGQRYTEDLCLSMFNHVLFGIIVQINSPKGF